MKKGKYLSDIITPSLFKSFFNSRLNLSFLILQLAFFRLRMFYLIYSIWGLVETFPHFLYLQHTYIIIILLSLHAKLTVTNRFPLLFIYNLRDSLLFALLSYPLQNLLLFWVFFYNGLLLYYVWSKTWLPPITILLNSLHHLGSLLGLLWRLLRSL